VTIDQYRKKYRRVAWRWDTGDRSRAGHARREWFNFDGFIPPRIV
jgi:hypothetical protein